MKQIYELAEMDISAFECEDVITTSGGSSGGLGNGGVADENNGPTISWEDFINGGK